MTTGGSVRVRVNVQVWWAAIDQLRPFHQHLLDRRELARRDTFVQQADRDRFALGAALVRLAAAAELSIDVGDVRIDRSCERCGLDHGRPRVVGTDLEVSVSHSAAVVAVATTVGVGIGIDVEQLRSIDFGPLFSMVLAPTEPRPDDLLEFYTYWTRKESFLKATGSGLPGDMSTVVVSEPAAEPRLLSHGRRRRPATLATLHPPDGYAACLTVLAQGPLVLREVSATALLAAGP
jgi:4'-phosphopantetheinyl transferase